MRNLVITEVTRPQPSLYFGPAEHGFLSWDTLIWKFAAERSYWVVTADPIPHSMPVWGIWHDSAFLFSTYPKSTKAQNLRNNPHATVHLADTEALFSMECDAAEVDDAATLKEFLAEYNPKYKWNFTLDDIREGVFALIPYKAFAWSSGEGEQFHNTATRFSIAVTDR